MEFFDEAGNVVPALGWANLAIREVDPASHAATGWYRWRGRYADGPASSVTLDVQVQCVEFLDADPPAAVFGGQIVRATGWADWWPCSPLVGRYVKIKVTDGGTPGGKGDRTGYFVGDCPPGGTTSPCSGGGGWPVYVELPVLGGNLVIHR
jgi:hypothetical protein